MHNRIKKYFDHDVHSLQLTIDIMNEVGVDTVAELQASQAKVAELTSQVERLTNAVADQDEIIESLFAIVNQDKFFSE